MSIVSGLGIEFCDVCHYTMWPSVGVTLPSPEVRPRSFGKGLSIYDDLPSPWLSETRLILCISLGSRILGSSVKITSVCGLKVTPDGGPPRGLSETVCSTTILGSTVFSDSRGGFLMTSPMTVWGTTPSPRHRHGPVRSLVSNTHNQEKKVS